MAIKNTVEVVIAGKVFRISGYESPEYLHQVSVYINEKLAQFQKLEGYRKQSTDQKQLMLNMNLADDFFKAKNQADKLSAELEKKEREMYAVRHDLIEAQMANEKLEAEKKEFQDTLAAQKKEFEEKLALQKQEAAEKLEAKKQDAERERQERKRTAEGQEKALENQKKAMEAQRLSSKKKLEEQNQAAQKRLAEQKRGYESEIEQLQREIRDLQRRLNQRSYT